MTSPGGDLLRLDTATALRRFWHLERALILSCGGWVPSVARLDTKAALAETAWESSLTADALRERVFELRYPDRTLDQASDAPLIALFERIAHAPDPRAFLAVLGGTFLPALGRAYEQYLAASDAIADGPTHRFLSLALSDKIKHADALREAATHERDTERGRRWESEVVGSLERLGGVPLGPLPPVDADPVDNETPHLIPDEPARDDRYLRGTFYWPDNFDPAWPYGDGIRLQLRTALSHLNEVWAVETAGAILFELGPELGWDFVMDAARWLYDESRHMTMGRLRLERWGFRAAELPLGDFIYRSCGGRSALYRLAMLSFFETKNIGKKAQRAVTFGELGDRAGQRDMEFDWADEAIHAGYGRRWLRAAMTHAGREEDDWSQLVAECEQLVTDHVARAPDRDKHAIRAQAVKLIGKAEGELASVIGGT